MMGWLLGIEYLFKKKASTQFCFCISVVEKNRIHYNTKWQVTHCHQQPSVS